MSDGVAGGKPFATPTGRAALLAGVLVLGLFCNVTHADTVVLDGGRTLEGIVTQKEGGIEVRVPEGVYVFRNEAVRSITRAPCALHEYERRRTAMRPDDAEAHYQLGLFCESVGLRVPAQQHFEAAARLNPAHDGARGRLGHTKVGKEWFTEPQYQETLGNVRVNGDWLARDVARAREELALLEAQVRTRAVRAYYQRLQQDEEAARGRNAAAAGANAADLTAKSAGPWLEPFLWPNGSRLRIVFGDGTTTQMEQVRAIAQEWTRYANLDFDFFVAGADTSLDDIRITFAGPGSYSAYGRQSVESARRGQPSMSLDAATHGRSAASWRRTVLHEFGHAIGLLHEHQNPNRTFHFDEAYIRKNAARLGLTEDEAVDNILTTTGPGSARGKAFDQYSIMLYALPPEATVEGVVMPWNTTLSPGDMQVAAALYPGRASDVAPAAPTPAPSVAPTPVNDTAPERMLAALEAVFRELERLRDPARATLRCAPARAPADWSAWIRGLGSTLMALRSSLENGSSGAMTPARAQRMNRLVQLHNLAVQEFSKVQHQAAAGTPWPAPGR